MGTPGRVSKEQDGRAPAEGGVQELGWGWYYPGYCTKPVRAATVS